MHTLGWETRKVSLVHKHQFGTIDVQFPSFFPPPWKCISSSSYKTALRVDTQTTSVTLIYSLKHCRDILMNNKFLSTVYLLRTLSPYVILSYQSDENIWNFTYTSGTVLIHFLFIGLECVDILPHLNENTTLSHTYVMLKI